MGQLEVVEQKFFSLHTENSGECVNPRNGERGFLRRDFPGSIGGKLHIYRDGWTMADSEEVRAYFSSYESGFVDAGSSALPENIYDLTFPHPSPFLPAQSKVNGNLYTPGIQGVKLDKHVRPLRDGSLLANALDFLFHEHSSPEPDIHIADALDLLLAENSYLGRTATHFLSDRVSCIYTTNFGMHGFVQTKASSYTLRSVILLPQKAINELPDAVRDQFAKSFGIDLKKPVHIEAIHIATFDPNIETSFYVSLPRGANLGEIQFPLDSDATEQRKDLLLSCHNTLVGDLSLKEQWLAKAIAGKL